jgi:hypothetical protein
MSKSFEDWKEKLEERALGVVDASPDDVEEAIRDVAVQMKDAEYVAMGERPIDEIINELEPQGWHYRGPLSHEGIFEAVAEEKLRIMIVKAGTQRYIFDRANGAN